MKALILSVICFLILPFNSFAVEKQGAYLGAISHEIPYWFKESFLEFEEDVAEAAQQNKRVMIYFSQNGCPYCARLIEENFAHPEIEAFVRKHFDGISINMWGDREVVSVGSKNFTEKTFAEALKVQYTPTLLFLNEQGKTILRLNGYYPPKKFRKALQFAAFAKEKELSFNEFMIQGQADLSGTLISEDFFLPVTDLQALLQRSSKPLAVFFESSSCEDCQVMHEKILTDAPTRKLVKSLLNVQLDVNSEEKIITHDGQKLSHKDYARVLNIGYTPSVVFFDDNGQVVHRIDGFLKTFHFQSSFAYVLEKGYVDHPSFQRYLSARGDKLREQGFDTDIWGYKSAYPAKAAQ